jgi:branched-chain amino acid transport system permease protein
MSALGRSSFLRSALLLCVPLVLLALLVSAAGSPVLERTVLTGLLNLVIVVALVVFCGNSGILSFGHVSFVLLGAYTSGLLTMPLALKLSLFEGPPGFLTWVYEGQWGLVPGLAAAALLCAVVGAVVAVPIARLTGVQAGAATLALFVIVQNVITETESVTRGTSTLIGVPPLTTLTVATVAALGTILVALAYRASPWGMRLRAAREDANAARAAGVHVERERRIAFVLSAAIAGLAGGLYASFLGSFSPTAFALPLTFLTIAMLVVGGMGSVSGAVAGVAFVTAVSELLRRVEVDGLGPIPGGKVPGLTEIVISLIIIATLVLRPQGIVGERELGERRWRSPRRRATDAPSPSSGAAQDPPSSSQILESDRSLT